MDKNTAPPIMVSGRLWMSLEC